MTPAARLDLLDLAEVARLGGIEIVAEGAGSRLSTETRVVTTDAATRRTFARYWLVVRTGSGLIRREMLRELKRRAERPSGPGPRGTP